MTKPPGIITNSLVDFNTIQDASSAHGGYLKAKVTVKGFELNANVPIADELMSKGLAVKNQLKENEAMLFVFQQSARHSFWMKDMKPVLYLNYCLYFVYP
jgi:hypothetical protein